MNIHGLDAEAVLFDCDGILVDSEPVSFLAWSTTLAAHGYTLDEAQFAESVGGTETMVARRFGPEIGIDADALEVEAREEFRRLAPMAQGFPDTFDLVSRLEADAVPMAVATNGLRWRLDVLLGAVGLDHLRAVSVTADEVAHPKPAPDLYVAAASLANTDPRRCVVLEDSPTGVAAAKAAGCLVVAVDRGMFERSRLAAADVVVERV